MELIRCGAAALLGAALAVAALSDLAWRIIPNGCVASVALSWLLVCGSGEKVVERSPLTSYTFEDAEPGIVAERG